MARSIRMFEIIQVLRHAKRPVTAQMLAAELEVTIRTVYRDIVALQSMRVPIEGEAGVGYMLRAGFDLPPLMFSAEEIEAIAMGLSLLGRTGDDGLKKAAHDATRKIAEVIPAGSRSSFTHSPLIASQWHEIPKAQIDMNTIRRCVREEEKLKLEYMDKDGRATSRIICPLAMIYYIDAIILAAWCELRENFRHFRIDRMASCLACDENFSDRGFQLRRDWQLAHPLE